jgi:hypothetical protein
MVERTAAPENWDVVAQYSLLPRVKQLFVAMLHLGDNVHNRGILRGPCAIGT